VDICLDTDAVIAILKNDVRGQYAVEKIRNESVFITSITLFELLLRERNLEPIELFRNNANLISFDENAARHASSMFKHLQKHGRSMDMRDLFIAATARAHDCKLLTFNKKHFEASGVGLFG
jgi:predicted nucleic acid-binding protein